MFEKLIVSCSMMTACFAYSAKEMSLEEKVGQILVVQFHGEEANEDAKALVQEMHVGGFIYYTWSNGLTSPAQVKALSAGLQKLTKGPRLFITTDQEGGIVTRLTQGFTVLPGNKALGMTRKPELAKESAIAIGEELQAVGINMNLSPVVDVNSNPRNPVIGIRSFGDSAAMVIAFGKKALEGYREAGTIACLKHFPGHGHVEVDSHLALPIVHKSKEELMRVELKPFAKLASQADMIMTAHLLMPALDPDNCSTLSKKTVDFLRKDLGFQGVIITDSLAMEGVLKKCGSVDEAAVQALNAGCDILMLGGRQLIGDSKFELTVSDIRRIHQRLVDAVKSGQISEERLDQAVEKVLELKNKYLVNPSRTGNAVKMAEHEALSKKIAALSVQIKKNQQMSFVGKKVVVIAPQLLKESVQQTSLAKMGQTLFFQGLNPTEAAVAAVIESANTADVIVFCSYNSWKNEAQAKLIQIFLESGKPVVLFAVRDPQDAALFPKAAAILTTFSPTVPSIQAACDRLSLSLGAEKPGHL